jgi:hypothetical protein
MLGEWFGQVVRGSGADGVDDGLFLAVRRNHHDRTGRKFRSALQGMQRLEAVHLRHVPIEQDQSDL